MSLLLRVSCGAAFACVTLTTLADDPPPKADRHPLVVRIAVLQEQQNRLTEAKAVAQTDRNGALSDFKKATTEEDRKAAIAALNDAVNRMDSATSAAPNVAMMIKGVQEEAKIERVSIPKEIAAASTSELEVLVSQLMKETATSLDSPRRRTMEDILDIAKGIYEDPLRVGPGELTHADRLGNNPLSGLPQKLTHQMKVNFDDVLARCIRSNDARRGYDERHKTLADSAFDGSRTFNDQILTGKLRELQSKIAFFEANGATRTQLTEFNTELRDVCRKLNIPITGTIMIKGVDER